MGTKHQNLLDDLIDRKIETVARQTYLLKKTPENAMLLKKYAEGVEALKVAQQAYFDSYGSVDSEDKLTMVKAATARCITAATQGRFAKMAPIVLLPIAERLLETCDFSVLQWDDPRPGWLTQAKACSAAIELIQKQIGSI